MASLEALWVAARAATFRLEDGGLYRALGAYRMTLNGRDAGLCERCVFSLYDLWPDTDYRLTLWRDGAAAAEIALRTPRESVTLDARAFGAAGDGRTDDTPALQAAILCCPKDGRVLVPAGRYLVSPLFLKSHVRVELAEGATLLLSPERGRSPVLPGRVETTDERGEYLLGTWEGDPLSCYASLFTGVEVRDVAVYGRGKLDGQGSAGDWWLEPRVRRGAWRGRMVFLCRCEDVTLQGLTLRDSPSWNVHPYFCGGVRLMDLTIEAPAGSPNTDGVDPESCADVLIAGVRFAVGDDCVAVKSGKRYMGRAYRTPCERLRVIHCLMSEGHGGVTVGSEMSGGVRDLLIRSCEMRGTDRGLRIKTRRGRGDTGVVDGVRMERVRMEGVRVPFSVNCFYFCDPDGHAPDVQRREAAPVDEGTPRVGSVALSHVTADGCTACAGYCLGLPERKIGHVTLEDVRVRLAPGEPFAPVMADGVAPAARAGLVMENVERLTLSNVRIEGAQGSGLACRGVDALEGGIDP